MVWLVLGLCWGATAFNKYFVDVLGLPAAASDKSRIHEVIECTTMPDQLQTKNDVSTCRCHASTQLLYNQLNTARSFKTKQTCLPAGRSEVSVVSFGERQAT